MKIFMLFFVKVRFLDVARNDKEKTKENSAIGHYFSVKFILWTAFSRL